MNADTRTDALTVLREAGLLADSIEFDGMLHRVPTMDKPNGKDGAYISHADAPVTVWWQNHRSGESGTWTAKGQDKMTSAERAALAQRMEANRKAKEAEQARVHGEAAAKAKYIYDSAADCTGHAYLERKGVNAVAGLRLSTKDATIGGAKFPAGSIVVPLRDERGGIATLQHINSAGEKRFSDGGRKRGCFFAIGGKDADKPLLIAEGLATAISLYECLGFPVLAAFDAGNLQPVAELARRLYPERVIVLCADNDIKEDGSANVGIEKATAAALAIDGHLAVPRRDGMKCDWNDLYLKMGAGEVRVQFQGHGKPEPPGKKMLRSNARNNAQNSNA